MAIVDNSPDAFVFLDCESTGLDSRARLIEIAGVGCSSDWRPNRIFHSLVNTGVLIPKEITRITGITNAMIADAPPLASVLQQFVKWLPSNVCVAHNANFDLRLLAREAKSAGVDLPDLSYIDTLPIARALGETPNSRLPTLIAHFRLSTKETPHRALSDAMSLIAFIQHLDATHRLEGMSDLLVPRLFVSRPQC